MARSAPRKSNTHRTTIPLAGYATALSRSISIPTLLHSICIRDKNDAHGYFSQIVFLKSSSLGTSNMATSDAHTALLDQLQAQVNQVVGRVHLAYLCHTNHQQLEQTGRVFAAMSANPKERPVAQIAKLQNVIPVAERRFHNALDQLEDELVGLPKSSQVYQILRN